MNNCIYLSGEFRPRQVTHPQYQGLPQYHTTAYLYISCALPLTDFIVTVPLHLMVVNVVHSTFAAP